MRSQSRRRCLFCDQSGKLSKEHIVPEWMGPYLPADLKHYRSGWLSRRDPETGQVLPTEQTYSTQAHGEQRSQTLRVVCEPCNNGWMSRIANEAKPALEPLIMGKWSDLSVVDQTKIATWFTLHNIVLEAAHSSRAVSSQQERDRYREERTPGPRRFIWIARSSDRSIMSTVGGVGGADGQPGDISARLTQVVVLAIGDVTLLSVHDPGLFIDAPALARVQTTLDESFGLRIWPPTENAKPPALAHHPNDLEKFSAEIKHAIEFKGLPMTPELQQMINSAEQTLMRQAASGMFGPKGKQWAQSRMR